MDYIAITTDNHLEHHGILGQKWGVRRYQNADGTLTAAGRKKYNKFDQKSYKEERGKELESKGYKGLSKAAQVNNEIFLLKLSDKKAYNSLKKQEKLASKIQDAADMHDAKQFSKLLKQWTTAQANIRYDEIMQNKDKFEPLAKAFIKARMGQTTMGILGSLAMGNEYFKLGSEYVAEAGNKAKADAEQYKKQFK